MSTNEAIACQMLPVPVRLPAAESPPSSVHLDGRGMSSFDSGSRTQPPPILKNSHRKGREGRFWCEGGSFHSNTSCVH